MAHAPSCVLVDATTGTTAGVHDDQDDCGGGCDQKHGHDQPAGATPRSKSEPFFLPSVEYGHGITSFPALPRFASTNGSGSSAAPASAGSPAMTPSHTWPSGCGRTTRVTARRPHWPTRCWVPRRQTSRRSKYRCVLALTG